MSIDVHLARYERFSVIEGCWIVTCAADLARFPDVRADSSRCDGVPSPQIEGETGERERGGVAGAVEIRHAAEAVAPLQGAEQLLHGAPAPRQRVVAGDLVGAQPVLGPVAPHDAVGDAAPGQLPMQPVGVVADRKSTRLNSSN